VDALSDSEPSRVIVQGVLPYRASVVSAPSSVCGIPADAQKLGFLAGGSDEGADSMVALTNRAAMQCPSARIIWGGYSQGAQVTHKAAAKLSTGLYSRIAGIVLFGDPYNVSCPLAASLSREHSLTAPPSRATPSPAR